MTFSDRLFARKSHCGFRSDGRIHIGYFSGSPTHEKDFALVADSLARMMDRDRRLHLTLVGYLNPGPVFDRHAGRVMRHPFTDFINLQKLIAATEINIAPLQDNALTNCGSKLKYFEAAVVGAIAVASPTFTLFPGEFSARLRDVQDKQSVALGAQMNCSGMEAHQNKKLILASSAK